MPVGGDQLEHRLPAVRIGRSTRDPGKSARLQLALQEIGDANQRLHLFLSLCGHAAFEPLVDCLPTYAEQRAEFRLLQLERVHQASERMLLVRMIEVEPHSPHEPAGSHVVDVDGLGYVSVD